MVSYRFLRPDDMPLIAQSVNLCYNIHYPHLPATSVAMLKREASEVNLWASSCMAAVEGDRPIAVITGCKRSTGTFISRVGVHHDYQGKGHGSHLLQSLSSKLAIIGPPDITAEVPEMGALNFFLSNDYEAGEHMVDWHQQGPLEPIQASGAIQQVGLGQLLGEKNLWGQEPPAWERTQLTLTNRKNLLECLALISPERVEAVVTWWASPFSGQTEVTRFGWVDAQRGPFFISLLLRHIASQTSRMLTIPKLAPNELPYEVLENLGFKPGITWRKCYSTARSY